ncbi:MAG: cold-shock protein [Pseudomonadales bacterium]|nr:cold-shock protein [Pseudomonadales bacterium]
MGIAAFILCGVVGVLLGARIASQAAPQRSGTASPHRSRSRPEAAPMPIGEREQGAVKWFNASKGFGFISRDSGGDVFVHFRSIRGTGHRALREAQRVEFNIADGDKGLQAIEVDVL